MSELNVTSSQSGAREELQQDDIWGETEEDIWAEIFHENGETLLRNIPSGDSPTNEAKLETIDFEDMYLEVRFLPSSFHHELSVFEDNNFTSFNML
jgi:hypothetical protein